MENGYGVVGESHLSGERKKRMNESLLTASMKATLMTVSSPNSSKSGRFSNPLIDDLPTPSAPTSLCTPPTTLSPSTTLSPPSTSSSAPFSAFSPLMIHPYRPVAVWSAGCFLFAFNFSTGEWEAHRQICGSGKSPVVSIDFLPRRDINEEGDFKQRGGVGMEGVHKGTGEGNARDIILGKENDGLGDEERKGGCREDLSFSSDVKNCTSCGDFIDIWVIASDDKSICLLEDRSFRVKDMFFLKKRLTKVFVAYDGKSLICGDKFGDLYQLNFKELQLVTKSVLDTLSDHCLRNSRDASAHELEKEILAVALRHSSASLLPSSASAVIPSLASLTPAIPTTSSSLSSPLSSPPSSPRLQAPSVEALDDDFSLPFAGHLSPVTAMSLSDNRRLIISGDKDEKIRIGRSLSTECSIVESYCLGHSSFISCLCPSSFSSSLLLSGSGDMSVRLWDVSCGLELDSFNIDLLPFSIKAVEYRNMRTRKSDSEGRESNRSLIKPEDVTNGKGSVKLQSDLNKPMNETSDGTGAIDIKNDGTVRIKSSVNSSVISSPPIPNYRILKSILRGEYIISYEDLKGIVLLQLIEDIYTLDNDRPSSLPNSLQESNNKSIYRFGSHRIIPLTSVPLSVATSCSNDSICISQSSSTSDSSSVLTSPFSPSSPYSSSLSPLPLLLWVDREGRLNPPSYLKPPSLKGEDNSFNNCPLNVLPNIASSNNDEPEALQQAQGLSKMEGFIHSTPQNDSSSSCKALSGINRIDGIAGDGSKNNLLSNCCSTTDGLIRKEIYTYPFSKWPGMDIGDPIPLVSQTLSKHNREPGAETEEERRRKRLKGSNRQQA